MCWLRQSASVIVRDRVLTEREQKQSVEHSATWCEPDGECRITPNTLPGQHGTCQQVRQWDAKEKQPKNPSNAARDEEHCDRHRLDGERCCNRHRTDPADLLGGE